MELMRRVLFKIGFRFGVGENGAIFSWASMLFKFEYLFLSSGPCAVCIFCIVSFAHVLFHLFYIDKQLFSSIMAT